MSSNKLLDAFNYVDEKYLQMEEDPKKKPINLHKKGLGLLAAAIIVSLLAGTAIAGLPTVFDYMKEFDPEDQTIYQEALEANQNWEPEPVELPGLQNTSLVVSQKYYNGETILLGLDLKSLEDEPAIGFEPDALLMKEMQSTTNTTSAQVYREEDWEIPYPRYARSIAAELKQELTAAQYQKVTEYMEHTGHCCVAFRDVYVGDHIQVNGIDMMASLNMNGDAGITEGATMAGEGIRLDPLPENARNQDSVTVTLDIKTGINYKYLDMEGHGYTYYGPVESETCEITIPRGEIQ